MKKDIKKTLMIIALISIALCGCPGCFFIVFGFGDLIDAIGYIQTFDDLMTDISTGFQQGGWMICVGGILVLIPFILVILAVIKRNKAGKLEALTPTGVSEEGPLPPPS